MNDRDCQRYIEDPDANSAHLETCAECRELFAGLDAEEIEVKPISVDAAALPLAPWEGATYRAWPLVLGGVLAVLAIALALFAVAGVSPLAMLSRAVPSLSGLGTAVQLAGDAVQHAPAGWQIGIAIAFALVNAVLFALLRRAPRGADV